MEGVYPSGASTGALRPQLDCQIAGYFPVRLGVAVARTIDRLVAGDVHDLANGCRVTDVLTIHRHRDLHHLVVGRPKYARASRDTVDGWRGGVYYGHSH